MERYRAALKKFGNQNAGDAGKMPLALKKFGTQNAGVPGKMPVVLKKVALKIQQGRKRRRETGVADEERCGEFALIFFRTKRLEEFTILVERGWNAGTVLFCSIR